MNLKGATALVTGGSNGIGLAIAKTLTEAGAKVAITGRDEQRLAAAGKATGDSGDTRQNAPVHSPAVDYAPVGYSPARI